jgi:hypothetical protein
MQKRVLQNSFITELEKNEIFVFGSNESGIHGGGAARTASFKFKAQMGVGFGKTGQCFAIPTKDWSVETLPLEVIEFYVKRFIDYAKKNTKYKFLVSEIGCGLAGYCPEHIAPFFKNALELENVYLPESFYNILNN